MARECVGDDRLSRQDRVVQRRLRDPVLALGILQFLDGAGVPLGELPRRYQELPRDREIVTQCKMGGRSAKAQDFLKSVGFTNVKNLKGGILDWIDKVDPSQPKY